MWIKSMSKVEVWMVEKGNICVSKNWWCMI